MPALFDSALSPLPAGINLIEAGAGAGKTYAIAMLTLRFVAEIGLDVKQLLVVTFTKAAAAELRERIRLRLGAARAALDGMEADDALTQWLAQVPLAPELLQQRLDLALLDIDQAAILTIHGFCQRALSEYALESGQMFDSELTGDIDSIRQNLADDFWRRQIYQRPLWQVALLTAACRTPDQLLASLPLVGAEQWVEPPAADLEQHFNAIRALLDAAAAGLPALSQALTLAFSQGKFKDGYSASFAAQCQALGNWLAEPEQAPADFRFLTAAGVAAGLHGNKFRVSQKNPLSPAEQKQAYIDGLRLDTAAFDALAQALDLLPVYFRRALLENVRRELPAALQQENLLSFDSLIERLAAALRDAEHGARLQAQMRQAYRAGLIDEFQDTDLLQWDIFAGLFSAPEQYLYLIGDPKQAIYKFRGADIFSYFAARERAAYQYTLPFNWRSHPDLVAAVNALFRREQPFLFAELAFHPAQAGRKPGDGALELNGETGGAPLQLLQLAANAGKTPHWTSGKALAAIREAVAGEVARLLEKALLRRGDRVEPLAARDIAILTRSNQQALEFQQSLQARGVPAIINGKQSVFAAPEASELHAVLQALAHPGELAWLTAALSLRWFGMHPGELNATLNDNAAVDGWLLRFHDYHQRWRRHGLLPMMQELLRREKVERTLAAGPQAERALTNLHHLLERLQQAAGEHNLTPGKTLAWLRQAMQNAGSDGDEERQLRLESDADAVQIVTLHSAKGLEYPVVFCPNPWRRGAGSRQAGGWVQCHEHGRTVADLGGPRFAERRAQAEREELAEDLRLFYVAVTRAEYRCYVYWADVRTQDKPNDSAFAYLMQFEDADHGGQRQILQALAQACPAGIAYAEIEAEPNAAFYRPDGGLPPLAARPPLKRRFDVWQMSSYTALSAFSAADAPELPKDKSQESHLDSLEIQDIPERREQAAAPALLHPGARTGNLVHSLLEILDFQALGAGADIRRERDAALRRYGLELAAAEPLDALLRETVNTRLPLGDFCLRDLEPAQCVKELPFYLAAPDLDTAGINRALQGAPGYQPLQAKQLQGFLTGFIDLFCAHQGRFYVIDYKTNSLPDYGPAALQAAMRAHNYALQYWLYVLAAHRYLRQRLPDYDYRRDFGGVMYLFVRGMHAARPGQAVFSDRPAAERLAELERAFFGNNAFLD